METAVKPFPPLLTRDDRKQVIDGAEGDWPEYAHYLWEQISKAHSAEQIKWFFETTLQTAKTLEAIQEMLKSTSSKEPPVAEGNDEGWWTTEQAAAYLKLKVATVRDSAAKGRIPGHKYPENSSRGVWRFRRRELDRFLSGRAKKAPQKGLEAW